MPAPGDMGYWLSRKYANMERHTEGEYQQNTANAYRLRELGKQVAPDAESQRNLQAAQAYTTRQHGITEETDRYTPEKWGVLNQLRPDSLRNLHDNVLSQRGYPPQVPGMGVPGIGGGGAPMSMSAPSVPQLGYPTSQTQVPQLQNTAPGPESIIRPTQNMMTPMSSANLMQGAPTQQRRQPQQTLNTPSLLRPTTPSFTSSSMATLRPNPLNLSTSTPTLSLSPASSTAKLRPTSLFDEEGGFRKGTADVKGKGGGLEAILPLLLAAGQGGGALAASPRQGLKKGSANVKAPKSDKTKAKDDTQPGGLEALLAMLAAGGAGPQAAPAMPMAPGMAEGEDDVMMNYMSGATSVPGYGSGTVDTVPAMLAPHEAVLNRAAADMLGRGVISLLNAEGMKQMGMRRGASASS